MVLYLFKMDDCSRISSNDTENDLKLTSASQLKTYRKKHEMILSLGKNNAPSINSDNDETPTPVRFLRECEAVGLFKDLHRNNPFEETFRKAAEEQANNNNNTLQVEENSNAADDTLHTPTVFPPGHHTTRAPAAQDHCHDVVIEDDDETMVDDSGVVVEDCDETTVLVDDDDVMILGTNASSRLSPPRQSRIPYPVVVIPTSSGGIGTSVSMVPSSSVITSDADSTGSNFHQQLLSSSVTSVGTTCTTTPTATVAPLPSSISQFSGGGGIGAMMTLDNVQQNQNATSAMVQPFNLVTVHHPVTQHNIISTIHQAGGGTIASGSSHSPLHQVVDVTGGGTAHSSNSRINNPGGGEVEVCLKVSSGTTLELNGNTLRILNSSNAIQQNEVLDNQVVVAPSTSTSMIESEVMRSVLLSSVTGAAVSNRHHHSSMTHHRKLLPMHQHSTGTSSSNIIASSSSGDSVKQRLKSFLGKSGSNSSSRDRDDLTSVLRSSSKGRILNDNASATSRALVNGATTLPPVSLADSLTSDSILSSSSLSSGNECLVGSGFSMNNSSSTDEKRQLLREKNRVAAMRCRERRKAWVVELSRRAEETQTANKLLLQEVSVLRAEVARLKALLLAHKDCPVMMTPATAATISSSSLNSVSGSNVVVNTVDSKSSVESTCVVDLRIINESNSGALSACSNGSLENVELVSTSPIVVENSSNDFTDAIGLLRSRKTSGSSGGAGHRRSLSLDIESAMSLQQGIASGHHNGGGNQQQEVTSPLVRRDEILSSVAPVTPSDDPMDMVVDCGMNSRGSLATPVIQLNPNVRPFR